MSKCCNSNGCCSDEKYIITEKKIESCSDDVKQMIQICMGGKCKILGANLLLKEFKNKVGVEGGVVGCKCVGKCRDGHNVKVSGGIEGSKKGGLCKEPFVHWC